VSNPAAERARRKAAAEHALRSRGLPLTVQRRRLLERFLGAKDHPTAEMIYRDVAPLIPGLSHATVYRTLETLVDLGLARRLPHPGGDVRYDPRLERHHHLLCEACGAVRDYASSRLDALPFPDVSAAFETLDYTVLFRGRCAACRTPRSRRG